MQIPNTGPDIVAGGERHEPGFSNTGPNTWRGRRAPRNPLLKRRPMQPAEAPSPGQTQDSGGGGGGPTTPSTLLYGAVPRRPNRYNDRFIPDRSTVDFDLANYLFAETKKQQDNSAVVTPQSEAYQKRLADSVFQGRDRIFRLKPLPSVSSTFQVGCTDHAPSTRKIRCIPQSAEWVLDASELVDDFYSNLLDWSSRNLLAIALRGTVALLNPSDWSTSRQLIVNEQCGPVTSINWNDDGQRLAIGLNDSTVEIWDTNSMRLLRILRGCHEARVGSLSWRNDILTTGGMDGNIVLNDVRKKSHIFRTYRGHEAEVCGLKWSGSGQRLASGGNDNRLHIWDLLYTPTPNQWLFRFDDHRAAVKVLAWCPFQSNLLASGGGSGDRCIKFWNINSGTCLNSVDTGSQVCALLWNKNEKELLSSHGFDQNQLILWRYPSMVRMAELKGHKSRVLFMAQSPDGCTVASAAGNDTLRLWNVFGDPRAHKTAKTTSLGPFSSSRCIVR